ncbi:ABC transporter ATP-binding protein [Fusibacter sp. Q10-2]|uniref:ABC transporter ATP-binding protein n=2 Tax=Fusibacter ferrireducens TaxID=2785058 RepID=A0ABR9ZRR7_9FIRM|nr:ABC transporter ATP-binding protein [Fusibacter ferrireducens]
MLEVKTLKKKYGEFTAVDGISLHINKGEVVGLLGPNGAGKSTTISMIATLFKPNSGEILFEGENIVKNPKVIQPFIGYVPQEIALYETLSGYENLKYFGALYGLSGKAIKEQIQRISKIIGIEDRLKDRVSTYSGGMKRRINIGVGLLHNPKLVIMDEPTVGIDPQSRNHILETVNKLKSEGISVLYTSHYMEEVEAICERIYIMDHGKIIADGTQEALLEQSKIQSGMKLKFEKPVAQIVDQIKAMAWVTQVQILDEYEMIIRSSGNGSSHKDILNALMAMNSGLISFDIQKPDLEQVFLHMTGRGLRD